MHSRNLFDYMQPGRSSRSDWDSRACLVIQKEICRTEDLLYIERIRGVMSVGKHWVSADDYKSVTCEKSGAIFSKNITYDIYYCATKTENSCAMINIVCNILQEHGSRWNVWTYLYLCWQSCWLPNQMSSIAEQYAIMPEYSSIEEHQVDVYRCCWASIVSRIALISESFLRVRLSHLSTIVRWNCKWRLRETSKKFKEEIKKIYDKKRTTLSYREGYHYNQAYVRPSP